MTRSACLNELASAIAAVRVGHPTRVAIDGVDGVGKTRLANELVAPLAAAGREIIRASVDGFHRPRAARYQRGRDSPEGYFLDSFDYAAVIRELLDPLGPGGSRRFRTAVFDYRTDSPVDVEPQAAAANAVLLMDGVFLQRPELAGSWDLRIWVDAPFDITVQRAVVRDAQGVAPDESAVRAQYARRYVPGQVLYLTQCRPRESADVVVNNADLENPELFFGRRT
jgi:uridine kinase